MVCGLRKMNWLRVMTLPLAVAVCAGLASDKPAAPPLPATAPDAGPLDVIYVFSPTCLKCRDASKLVEAAVRRYGQKIRLLRMDIQDPDALERMETASRGPTTTWRLSASMRTTNSGSPIATFSPRR